MSDIEFRVDEAFSSAVQQQLDEQRKIRQLVSRVDETLVTLSDGMGDLSGQLDLTVQQLQGATPADVERARAEIIEHVGRIAAQIDAVEQAAAGGGAIDRLDGQISSLASEVVGTRSALLDAMDRLEVDSAPIVETVDRIRQEVVQELGRIPAALQSHQDEVWSQAVGRLDQAIQRIASSQDDDHQAVAEMMTSWKADAAQAIQVLGDLRAERDLTLLEAIDELQSQVKGVTSKGDTADRDLADRVMSATTDLAAEVASRHEDLLGRLTQVATVANSVGPGVRDTLDQIASRLADMVSRTHDDAMQAVEAAGAARGATPEEVRGIVGNLVEHMDSRVNSALADVVERNARAADAVARAADVLERRAQASTTHLDQISERLMSALAESTERQTQIVDAGVENAVAALLSQQTDSSRHVREATEVLLAAVTDLEPQVSSALGELRGTLLQQAGADRSEVDAAFRDLAAASAEARDGVLDAVGQATTRLAEVQAEGIGRLAAVTDELGRVPDAISPAVLSAVEDMHSGVADAIRHLREQSQDASRHAAELLSNAVRDAREQLTEQTSAVGEDAANSWQRLTDVQQTHAATLDQATSALAGLAEQLAPQLQSAIAQNSTALGEHIEGASSTMHTAAREAGALIRQEAADAGAGVRTAADESAALLQQAVGNATAQMADSNEQSRAVLEQASGKVVEASAEVAEVMGATRTGLLEAVAEAKAEIVELLARTDHSTTFQITEAVASASERWLAEVSAQGVALSTRTQEIIRSTAQITPAVDALVARLKGEVAAVASQVLADVHAPMGETQRLVAALEPSLQQLVNSLREALQVELQQAAATATASTEKIAQAADAVDQQTTEQVGKLVDAAASLEATSAQIGPEIGTQLQALQTAVSDTGMVVDNRLSTIADATEAQLDAVRKAVVAHEAIVANSTQSFAGEIDAGVAKTRDTLSQGMEVLVAGLTTTLQSHLSSLQTVLEETVEGASGAATSIDETATKVQVAVQHALGALTEDLATQAEDVQVTLLGAVDDLLQKFATTQQQMVTDVNAATQQALTQTVASNDRLREELSAQLSQVTERLDGAVDAAGQAATAAEHAGTTAEGAAAQAGRTSQDLVGIGSQVVGSIESAVVDFGGRLQDTHTGMQEALEEQVAMMIADVRGSVLSAVATATTTLEARADELHTRINQVEGLDTDRVMASMLEQVSAIPSHIQATVEAAVESAVHSAMSSMPAQVPPPTPSPEAQRSLVEDAVRDAFASLPAADSPSDPGQVHAAVDRLEQLAGELSESDDRRGVDLKRLQSALTDLHGEMRADGDALLDAVASRVDQVISRISSVASSAASSADAGQDLAATASLVSDAVAHLQALGSQMERQVQRVEQLDDKIDQTLRRGLADLQASRAAAPGPGRQGGFDGAGRTGALVPPPAFGDGDEVIVTTSSNTTCPECGFVARTRQGLMAHRQTCATRP